MLTQHQRGDDHRRCTLHLLPHALFHLLLLRLTLHSHLPLSWPLCLPYPPSALHRSPQPHEWPTSLRAHRDHSNLCGGAWWHGGAQWLFLVLLAERAVLCANGFCSCCLTLNSPPTPPQGRASGPYRRPLSPPNKCYSGGIFFSWYQRGEPSTSELVRASQVTGSLETLCDAFASGRTTIWQRRTCTLALKWWVLIYHQQRKRALGLVV